MKIRRPAALAVAPVVITALAACDPDPGSVAACEAGAATVDLATVSDAVPAPRSAELQAWLATGGYADFLPESAAHPSVGPHGRVRTFVNRQLATSLTSCSESHPLGSAAVKELFTEAGLRGWAVMIKTEAGPGANAWYWYEVFSTATDATPAVSGQSAGTCTGCHDGGLDAVRTRWPLS